MPETYGNKQVVQGEDIILLVDDKTTLHATTHTLKVDLEMKELRTKDTDGKEKWPGDVSWSVDGDGLVVVDDSVENSHTAEEVLDLVLRKNASRWSSSRRSRDSRRCTRAKPTLRPSRSRRLRATTPLTVIRLPAAAT